MAVVLTLGLLTFSGLLTAQTDIAIGVRGAGWGLVAAGLVGSVGASPTAMVTLHDYLKADPRQLAHFADR